MISSSSMQPLVLVYKRWRDDLVCRHRDEVLFWVKMFFQLGWKGAFPRHPISKVLQSFRLFHQIYNVAKPRSYKESYSKWWFEGGGDEPLVPQEAYFANFLGKFFSKLPQFFSLGYKDICQFLTDLEFLLWNEVRNWFLTCSNFAQLMLVTTATSGGKVLFSSQRTF